jgi:hypothetical protein
MSWKQASSVLTLGEASNSSKTFNNSSTIYGASSTTPLIEELLDAIIEA